MRWFIRVASALLVFALLALAAVFLIPAEKVAGLAAQQFTKLTGRELVISGSVRPSFYPVLGVTTGPISVANASWSTEGPLLSAQSMEIALDLTALMGGDVRITGLQVTDPVIVLERNADGLGNWDFRATSGSGGTAGPATPGQGTPFTLDQAVISGGSLRYIDRVSGRRVDLAQIEATARMPDFDGTAEVSGTAVMGGQDLALTASLAQISAFLAGGLVPAAITARVGAANLAFDGQASLAPIAAEGSLDVDLDDVPAFFGLLGLAKPDMTEGLGSRAVSLKGAVTLTPEGSAHVRGGAMVLDGNALSGDLDFVTAGDRPKLSAKLTGGHLVIGGEVVAAAARGDQPRDPGGWSTDPIDVSALSAMDAAVALSANSLTYGGAKAGPLKVLATLERGRAVLDFKELAIYGGAVTGEFVVNGRKGLSVGGDLRFVGIALQSMLNGLAGFQRVTGTGDGEIRFLASGPSQAALMEGLSGSGSFALTNGEVAGVDVPGILRTLDPSYVGEGTKTVYDAVVGSFVIEQGVLANDDLRLDAPGLTASGNGTVGIGARDIDYRIRPTAVIRGGNDDGIAVPLLITGPWAKPRFRLDVEAVAQERLEAEAEKLQAKAEAAIAEELGIKTQDGESLEDAGRRQLNDKLQDEASKALQNLLGIGD